MSRKKTKIKIFSTECDLDITIFSKEACNYERLTYDSFLYYQNNFVCFIYLFFSILLIFPNKEIQFFVTNSLLFIILFSSIIFNIQIDKNYFWVLNIIYIAIILFGWYFNFFILNKQIKGKVVFSDLNFIIAYSVSGFLFGDEIVEMRSLGKVLTNFKRWIIIIFFSLFFNSLLYFGEFGLEISLSFTISYLTSNLLTIAEKIKLPVDTIINSLLEEGFKSEHLEKFTHPKYIKYFYIYLAVFSLTLLLKIIIIKFNKK